MHIIRRCHSQVLGVVCRYAPPFSTTAYSRSTLRTCSIGARFRTCRTSIPVCLGRPFMHLSDARTCIRAYWRWEETLLWRVLYFYYTVNKADKMEMLKSKEGMKYHCQPDRTSNFNIISKPLEDTRLSLFTSTITRWMQRESEWLTQCHVMYIRIMHHTHLYPLW